MDTIRRLDLNLIVTLEALLIEKNVTRAAKRLNLSQPAVSAQLSRLRTLFEDPLLLPQQRGMLPTAKAIELLPHINEALAQVQGILNINKEFDPANTQLTINIACSDYLQTILLQKLIISLRERAPFIKIALHELEPDRVGEKLESGIIDIVIQNGENTPKNLNSCPLYRETYVLAARRNHPLLSSTTLLTADDYIQMEHVVVSPQGGNFRTPIDDVMSDLGICRNSVLSASSFMFVPEFLANSDLVALIPTRLAHHHKNKLTIVPPPFPVPGFDIELRWHNRTDTHPGYKWTRQYLLNGIAP